MMKKIIATIASLAMLAGTCAMPVAAEETTTYALGDVTMDGKIDIADVLAVMRHYHYTLMQWEGNPDRENYKLTDEQLPFADVTDDGEIDCRDACPILQYYAYSLIADEPISPEEFYELSSTERAGYFDLYMDYMDGDSTN